MIITGKENINLFRMITLRGMLKLEMLGMTRSRRPSAYVIIKNELNIKGSRQKVLEQLNAHIAILKQAIEEDQDIDINEEFSFSHPATGF